MSVAKVRRIPPDERKVDDPTPGQTRELAFDTELMWCGVVRAEPGAESGWHHHGDHTTAAFVVSGVKRLEFGSEGRGSVEAYPGDFLFIPPEQIHRESNPSETETATVAFRVGRGKPTIAVDGPNAQDEGEGVRAIRPDEREETDPTPGMVRERAVLTDEMWAGYVRTAAGSVSGWHHHGANETGVYVVGGVMRIESGPGGAEVVDLGPGDFCHIPPGIVHRESNPGNEESQVVVVRAGSGPPTVNVAGPQEA